MVNLDKPFRTGTLYGIPIIVKVVEDEVKEFLEIMEAVPDSYVQQDSGVYYLYLPGQSRFEINKKFLARILECLSEDALTDKLYLCKISLKTIRMYQ